MGKRIPIDDLFREKLSGGEEQLNLGAWANMERMLDGKDPYAREDGKKRRFLPLLLAFTLLSGMLTAGYVALKKEAGPGKAETAYFKPQPESTPAASPATPAAPATNHAEQAPGHDVPAAPASGKIRKATAAQEPAVITAANPASNQTPSAAAPARKNRQTPKANNDAPGTSLGGDEENISEPMAAATQTGIKGNAPAANSKPVPAQEAPKTPSTEITTTPAAANAGETVNRLNVRERVKTKRNGDVELQFDTLGMTRVEKETTPTAVEEARPVLTPEQSNPRLVALTPEQELAMQSGAPVLQAAPAVIPSPAPAAAKTAETKAPALAAAHPRKSEGEGFFDRLRNFAAVSAQRVSLLTNSLINLGYPMIPGISVGVNAALFNTANNFGGFHIGFTNLKPLGGTVSLMTELKYFIRNNSGYTVNDVSTLNRNFSEDHVTLANQNKTIYTYQTDSTVNTFNFKNFSTLELPVMAQVHLRAVHLYGGANFAYSFPLAVKEIKRNYVLNHEEILDNSATFTPVAEKGRLYSRDDFGARFGIGYTIGGGYSFNPNLSVDLRLTQNLWTSAKTLGQREVSAGYFRVPTLQLSLAYRFKKWVPNNR